MPKLTRQEREKVIIQHIKGNPTPGYEVQERPNGKYLVKVVEPPMDDFEIEEEDEQESPPPRQNARELLRQLSELIDNNAEDNPQPTYAPANRTPTYSTDRTTAPTNWNRKRLCF